jgi:two-component system CheB/CheR fusion protein
MRTNSMDTDAPQQEPQPEQRDDTITPPFNPFPLVGIGASAGGLQALQQFFTHMPADSGMAFVVIMHLSPTYKSHAASLLQHTTEMAVVQVTEAVPVAPNHVYVIPPAQDLSMVDGAIHLQEREESRARHAPIDLFFRTLAETHGRSAAAVVLSGSGADGTSGIKWIKEHGGVALAQEPEEAEYAGMPRSAIATGMVDYILPVTALPDALVTYWRNAATVRLPDAGAVPSSAVPPSAALSTDAAEALRELFALLRARTNHDFSQYKRPTLLRRIGRRMQIHGVADLPAYVLILRAELDEVQALLRDLLISVTHFFRDPEAWLSLESLLPQIFAGRQVNDQVRVWVAGCATGEEAYTIAMLLAEYAATLDQPPRVQVFATDINENAISTARQGLYRETIAADVSPERLARFFVAEQGGYRIKRELRDLVLFAGHNLLRDPPFSRLDLITCRNLLIYLNRDVQEQVLKLFHFTLQPNGYLLLGASETVDGVPSLFTTIEKNQRLFQRRTAPSTMPANMPNLPLAGPPNRPVITGRGGDIGSAQVLADVHQQLLAQYAPPSVLINQGYDIVRISRGGRRFLELTEGELSTNVLKLIHPNLRIELRTALFQAIGQDGPAETRPVRLDLQGETRLVGLLVQPLQEPEWMRGYVMVIFNESANISGAEPSAAGDAEPLVRQLEEELQRTRDQLRTTLDQYETSDEEHKASNEELQAINEELRATTEELETSKEELQSINEELTTINQEMEHKVEELGQSNNDLQNLMASTQIGTIFVDRDLRIRRYTASAQAIFNLIPSDVNRPLAHITHKLDYDELAADVAQVIESLAKIEREMQSQVGRWYLARILPYRTFEDTIDGVTLTFVDITDLKQVEAERERLLDAVQQARAYAEQIVETVRDPLLVLDPDLRVQTANHAFYQLFQVTPAETEQTLLYELGDGQWDHPQLRTLLSAVLTQHTPVQDFEVTQTFPLLGARTMRLNARQIEQRPDQPALILLAIEDITARQQAADALRQAHDSLEEQVQERTSALVAANAALQAEISEHKQTQQTRQLLLHQLITTQEEERRHIARELHDQMGQDLTALLLEMKALQNAVAADASIAGRVAQVQVLAMQISAEVRTLALQLHPPALDHIGLVATLANYVEEWSARALVPVDFHTTGLDGARLPATIEMALYRLVQECLTNILKHAQATDVSLIIERRADALQMIVEDDGVGFDIAAAHRSAHAARRLGLIGMQERVAQLGGALTIESEPGRGTNIIVRIPFADAVAGDADGYTSDLSG